MFEWLRKIFVGNKPVPDTPKPFVRPESPTFDIRIDETTCRFENWKWTPDTVKWNGMEVKLSRDSLYIVPRRIWDVEDHDSASARVEIFYIMNFPKELPIEPSPEVVRAFAHLLCYRNPGNRIRLVSGRMMMYIPKTERKSWEEGSQRLFALVSLWNQLYEHDSEVVPNNTPSLPCASPLNPLPNEGQPLNKMQKWILSCFDGSTTDWGTASWNKDGFSCRSNSFERSYDPRKTAFYGALLWDWASLHFPKNHFFSNVDSQK